jgi:erythromycin esterase-like protein
VEVIDSLAPKPHSFKTLYYKQVLKSVKKSLQANSLLQNELSGRDEQRLYTFSSNLRDEQMADNLLWYIRQYPNKKFIVSAHNTHLLTGFDPAYPAPFELDTVVKKYRCDAIQMGYIVKDSLGDKVYNIGMVSNRGSAGRIDLRDSKRNFISNFNPFDKKEPLENLLYAAGFTYAFVDLKNLPKGGEWLKGRFPLRYYTGVNFSIEAQWHKLTDGILYIKELTPAYVR